MQQHRNKLNYITATNKRLTDMQNKLILKSVVGKIWKKELY